ncbi:hypothetical protein RvVAT039_pl08890 (plasmid) [Agrobacterium vitis]|nr:hypothetical protein RvVAT039_pl08890 [Agrobacterium vitis]
MAADIRPAQLIKIDKYKMADASLRQRTGDRRADRTATDDHNGGGEKSLGSGILPSSVYPGCIGALH